MAYGRNEGRFREIRIGRFAANMGGEGVPVKSTDVEREPNGPDRVSKKLQNTRLSCAPKSDSGRSGRDRPAATMLFLASDDASNVQGAEIFVDGGATASPAGAPIYRG